VLHSYGKTAIPDIFISYAREDKLIAERVAHRLGEEGWQVFWGRNIEAGLEWNDEIQTALQRSRIVLVLWSKASRNSFWVRGEAADACERDTYLPVLIDSCEPPRLFRHVQVQSLASWLDGTDKTEIVRLANVLKARIGELPMYGNLESAGQEEPVTDSHLHLVHSCWRVDKQTVLGQMPYQIHVIVYGHWTALKRVESVEYLLPGYPKGHDRQPSGPKERLFELKELANGFSIIQAVVRLRQQPPGHPKSIRLSRFVNMSESGPRLFDDFIRRVPSEIWL